MENDQLISIDTFCAHYGVAQDFIESLHENGLIETVVVQHVQFLELPHLEKVEKMVRLHNDLHINLEGLGAIHTLLERIENMDREMLVLRNRLLRYE